MFETTEWNVTRLKEVVGEHELIVLEDNGDVVTDTGKKIHTINAYS